MSGISVSRISARSIFIATLSLFTVGKTNLKDPANPMAEVNRRVQVVNTENKATASKQVGG